MKPAPTISHKTGALLSKLKECICVRSSGKIFKEDLMSHTYFANTQIVEQIKTVYEIYRGINGW